MPDEQGQERVWTICESCGRTDPPVSGCVGEVNGLHHRIEVVPADHNRVLEAELARLREAMASAGTSLSTGPGEDGYALSVLDEALGKETT